MNTRFAPYIPPHILARRGEPRVRPFCIRTYHWDSIIEKHEGPEDWASTLGTYNPEFLSAAGFPVLLPVGQERNPDITILRSIVSRDGDSLTVFLKDTTHYPDPEDELFWTGRMAVCDRVLGEDFFLAIVFHECSSLTMTRPCVKTHGYTAKTPRSTASRHWDLTKS